MPRRKRVAEARRQERRSNEAEYLRLLRQVRHEEAEYEAEWRYQQEWERIRRSHQRPKEDR